MARPLTYRRHGRHRSYDRLNRRTDSQASPGLGQDAQRFVDEQQVRLDSAEGSEGIFDAMHLEQGEDGFSTFDQVREAADPSDIGLSPSFVAQTQSINFNGGTDQLSNQTDQVIGVANVWTMMIVVKIDTFANASSFDCDNGASTNRINFNHNPGAGLSCLAATQFNVYNGVLSGDAGSWISLTLTWDGVNLRAFRNAVDVGEPDTGTSTPSITMTDATRRVSLMGNSVGQSGGTDGRMLWAALWRTELSGASITAIDAARSSINLNVGADAGDLAHWWRCGEEASPNLGKDFAEAAITPTIDVETDSIGIIDADRVADVP